MNLSDLTPRTAGSGKTLRYPSLPEEKTKVEKIVHNNVQSGISKVASTIGIVRSSVWFDWG